LTETGSYVTNNKISLDSRITFQQMELFNGKKTPNAERAAGYRR
jgi:hypothetical protein